MWHCHILSSTVQTTMHRFTFFREKVSFGAKTLSSGCDNIYQETSFHRCLPPFSGQGQDKVELMQSSFHEAYSRCHFTAKTFFSSVSFGGICPNGVFGGSSDQAVAAWKGSLKAPNTHILTQPDMCALHSGTSSTYCCFFPLFSFPCCFFLSLFLSSAHAKPDNV